MKDSIVLLSTPAPPILSDTFYKFLGALEDMIRKSETPVGSIKPVNEKIQILEPYSIKSLRQRMGKQ